ERIECDGERRSPPAAIRYPLEEEFGKRRMATLAHQLEMTEPGPTEHLAVAILSKRGHKRRLHLEPILAMTHADEIDDNRPRQAPQPHLARHFGGGGEVGGKRRRTGVAPPLRGSAVDVDHGRRRGVLDDEGAALLERNAGRECAGNFFTEAAVFEERRPP